MSHLDPNRDFRDPNEVRNTQWEAERNTNATWGWILGGIAAVVLVLVALTFARNDTDQTASDTPQRPTASQPANPTATAPTQPRTTTGQAPADNRPVQPAPQSPAPQR